MIAVEIEYLDLRKNKRIRKKFKSEKAFEKWLDKNEGNIMNISYAVTPE